MCLLPESAERQERGVSEFVEGLEEGSLVGRKWEGKGGMYLASATTRDMQARRTGC